MNSRSLWLLGAVVAVLVAAAIPDGVDATTFRMVFGVGGIAVLLGYFLNPGDDEPDKPALGGGAPTPGGSNVVSLDPQQKKRR